MLSTKIGTQFSLAIFFLYFVLLSGDCHTLLNCDLQKYFRNSVWLKHVIVFFTIFLFTFMLDWYTYDSLVVGKETYENHHEQLASTILSIRLWSSHRSDAYQASF